MVNAESSVRRKLFPTSYLKSFFLLFYEFEKSIFEQTAEKELEPFVVGLLCLTATGF